MYILRRVCVTYAYLFRIDYVCVKGRRRETVHAIIMSKDVECAHACTSRNQLWMVCHHHARIGIGKDKDIYTQREHARQIFLAPFVKLFYTIKKYDVDESENINNKSLEILGRHIDRSDKRNRWRQGNNMITRQETRYFYISNNTTFKIDWQQL